jgi:nucleotide-binding universal stress UspA family protein
VFETILVGIDHSDHSQHALSAATELAKAAKGQVRVVHVREMSIGKPGPVPKEFTDEANAVVDEAVKALAAGGLTATGTVRDSHTGRVAGEILAEAASSGASVIVMGSRGLTDLEGLVLGSTTHKVLHLGAIPVLVVR